MTVAGLSVAFWLLATPQPNLLNVCLTRARDSFKPLNNSSDDRATCNFKKAPDNQEGSEYKVAQDVN